MHNFCGVDLSKFKQTLELDGLFTELQLENNILYKNLIATFLHAKLTPPFIHENALLTEHLDQYLFLSRLHTMADILHICKPDKFTIKMPFADLCPRHKPKKVNPNTYILYNEKTWYGCNNCYIQHAKSRAIKQAVCCLNSLSSLPADNGYLEHLDHTLGMRVAYCVKLLVNLEFYNKYDYELATIYLRSKELLENSLYKLLKNIENTTLNQTSNAKSRLIAVVKQKFSACFTRGISH